MNILMVLTSHDQLGDTGDKTGFWLEEFAAPYYVFRDAGDYDEDIALDEFSDEIEAWIIAELKKIGLDTGRAVLAVNKEDIVRRTELEEEQVDELFRIIKQEFNEEEEENDEAQAPTVSDDAQ